MKSARTITVLLFTAARDAVGCTRLEVPARAGLTAGAVWSELVGRHPRLKPLSSSISVAVNHQLAPRDALLTAGDELAFLPPVSGG